VRKSKKPAHAPEEPNSGSLLRLHSEVGRSGRSTGVLKV
jgi:hypothetical protein